MIKAHKTQPNVASIPSIKNIIAVGSGKGGVGKSTVAVNLAIALKTTGASVGLLDADIYGPSVPAMLGITEKAKVTAEKRFEPIMAHGLYTLSIGNLVDQTTAMIWRGPMVSRALQQLLFDTHWPALDYLIVDLPPGTGDIQLTMAQKMPVSAAIVVTTPQTISVLDARKAIEMFKKVDITVLGIVENMSEFHCPSCDHVANIFGDKGGEQLANEYQIPLLSQLPIDLSLREKADEGEPMTATEPSSTIATAYQLLAKNVADELSKQPVNHAHNMPRVVVE